MKAEELNKIPRQDELQNFVNAAGAVNIGVQEFSQKLMPCTPLLQKDIIIPGRPGSMSQFLESYNQLCYTFTMHSNLLEEVLHNNCITSINKLMRIEKSKKAEREGRIHQMLQIRSEYESKLMLYQIQVKSYSNQLEAFNNQYSVTSKAKAAKVIEPIYAKYAFAITNYYSYYENYLRCCEEINNIRQEIYEMDKKFAVDCQKIIMDDSLSGLINEFQTFHSMLEPASIQLQEASDSINFGQDIHPFINKMKIAFVDTHPPPFERFRFSSPFVSPDVRPQVQFKLFYYPLYMAEAIADFHSEDTDELELAKGDRVFVMENPKNGWTFVLRMSYQKFGFVPETYIKKVGIRLAVAPRHKKNNLGILVSIMSKNGTKCKCEDNHHHKFSFNESALYIL